MKCAHCERSFHKRGGFVLHLQSHKPQNYGCAQCGRTFFLERSLRQHLNIVHIRKMKIDITRPFQCDICLKSYRTHKDLLLHASVHKPRQFKCSKCDAEFGKLSNLDKHLLLIHQLIDRKLFRPTVLECHVCGKHLPTGNSLNHHLMLHSAPQLSCNKCDIKFVAAYLHVIHMKNFHNPKWTTSSPTPDSYTCAICCRPFYRIINIVRHLNGHYPGRTIFPLGRRIIPIKPSCLRVVAESTKLEVQKVFQNLKHEFICAICGKRFALKQGLQLHLSVHTSTQLSCSLCAKRYKRIDSLHRHLLKKHSISQQRHEPKCKICGTKCKNVAALAWHKRKSHTAAKLICEYCGMKVTVFRNLVRHIQSVHSTKWKMPDISESSGKRPVCFCSVCCRPFGARKYKLFQHLKKHHS